MRRKFKWNDRVYVGLDLSLTGTGYAAIRGDETLESGSLEKLVKKMFGVDRLDALEYAVLAFCSRHNPEKVAIEDYAYGMSNKAHQMGEWSGVARLAMARARINLFTIPIAVNKKFATGKGNTPKSMMAKEVYIRWKHNAKTDDEADAYALARVIQAIDHGLLIGAGVEPIVLRR